MLALLIVDQDGNGFGSNSASSIDTAASLAVDTLYGGDRILARNTTQVLVPGVLTVVPGAATFNLASAPAAGPEAPANAQFGIIWFDTVPASETSLASYSGATYHFVTVNVGGGTDWKIPAADGTYTFGTDFVTAPQAQASTFTVVPEPSACSLLFASGCTLLIRRRKYRS
jgi:hypothetical protein